MPTGEARLARVRVAGAGGGVDGERVAGGGELDRSVGQRIPDHPGLVAAEPRADDHYVQPRMVAMIASSSVVRV